MRLVAIAAVLAIGVGPTFRSGASSGVHADAQPAPNILLITLDTVRADRIGAYGYKGASTPTLDRLAAEGVRFADATSASPLTAPAHTAMLTGHYPGRFAIRNNAAAAVPDSAVTLAEALAMRPEHLSLYLLEVHQGTPLAEQLLSGRRPMPDEDAAAEMYETMLELTEASGCTQYEISNFSLPGFESRHNTKYWRLDPVFGFGVSAHSFDGTRRYSNDRDTAGYVKRIEEEGSAEVGRESIDLESEFIFLGLRLN